MVINDDVFIDSASFGASISSCHSGDLCYFFKKLGIDADDSLFLGVVEERKAMEFFGI